MVEVIVGRLGGLLRVLPTEARVDTIVGFNDGAKVVEVLGRFSTPVVNGRFGGTVDFMFVGFDASSTLSFDIGSASD